ncbi:hypothetical protein SteCoe_26399 [Stentor coeruleus]|uniref:Tyrosine-protein kinase ephrin type A/B receptor-like domain-containing protein n=1 Tax=Stentor coeruleus TaxID=5963 RepID=A0A1R2BCY3_9CILI|nr:hypothetical protein SteCoe_26399 [Stentor coeruleus]
MRHKCWMTSDSDFMKIHIVGGATFEFYPNPILFIVQLYSDSYIQSSIDFLSENLVMSENDIFISNNRMFMVFGSGWNKIAISNITVMDLVTHQINTHRIDLQSCEIYGHSVSHYGDAFYMFGGGNAVKSAIIPNSINNILYKITIKESSFEIPCSEGTIKPDCTPCTEGTYFLIDHCQPCPKGTYSSYISATNVDQCYPCPAGKYSPDEGLSYCIECPIGTECPVGTFNPIYILDVISSSSIQPLAYSGQSTYITENVIKMWYSVVAFCFLMLFLAVIFNKVWMILSKVDVFANQHSQDLNVPIIYKKTNIGGLFSLLFILVAFVSIAGSIMNYTLNNITEIKALVPVMTIEDDILAKSFAIVTTFYTYGGKCISSENVDTILLPSSMICLKDISYTIEGLSYSSVTNTCEMIDSNCIVRLEFSNLELIQSIASVYIELKESRSFANNIGVNITSSSSIPNEVSNIFVIIEPPSKNYLFRGTVPTTIYFKLTPSVFTSESTEWPSFETGFHISTSENPDIGSIATQKTIYSQAYLRTLINIEKSETGMKTQRKLNNTLFVFIGGLLGSVFGLMGIFTTAMVFTEGLVGYAKKKEDRKIYLNDLYKNMEKLNYEFNRYKMKSPDRKIRPTRYQITTHYSHERVHGLN